VEVSCHEFEMTLMDAPETTPRDPSDVLAPAP